MLFPQEKVWNALEKDLGKFSESDLVRIRSKIKRVYIHLMVMEHSEGRQRVDQPKKCQPKKCFGIGRSLPPEEKKDEDKDSHLIRINLLTRINNRLKLELDCRLASLNPTVDKIQGAVGCRATLCILIKMN